MEMILDRDSCYCMMYYLGMKRFIQVPAENEKRTTLNIQSDIPLLIRQLRERTGLAHEHFAAELGVTFPNMNRWENGRAMPSLLAVK